MTRDDIKLLRTGQELLYTGELLIMRDAAHKKLYELWQKKEKFPFDISNHIVFYAGPAKKAHGQIIGAIGPTTSARMDSFLEMLFENGVIATLGKGKRSAVNRQMCQKYSCAYLVTPSGAAAALSQRVQSIRVVAYEELLSEAIQLITVRDFPMIVATDTTGEELFM